MGKITIDHWKPIHETIVALHLSGETNKYIGKITGYTAQHVSNVINCPKGQKRVREFTSRMRMRMHEEIGDEVVDLARRSLPNLEKTVDADISMADIKAKKHQDNVGLDLLAIAGYTKGSQEKRGSQSPRIDRDIQERLAEAFEKTAEAESLREAPLADVVEESDG